MVVAEPVTAGWVSGGQKVGGFGSVAFVAAPLVWGVVWRWAEGWREAQVSIGRMQPDEFL